MRSKVLIILPLLAGLFTFGNLYGKGNIIDPDSLLFKKESLSSHLKKASFYEKTNLVAVNKQLLTDSEGEGKINVLSNIAFSFMDTNTDSALYYYNKVVSLSRKFGRLNAEAYAHLNIGYIYLHIDDNPNALDEFQKALSLFKKIDYKKGMADSYQAISKIFLFFGDLQNALNLENEAVKNYTQINDMPGYYNSIRHIGQIYLSLGDSTKSLEILNDAVKSALRKNDKKIISSLYQSLGFYYSAVRNYSKAVEYLKKGLYLRITNRESVINIINNYNSLGDAYGGKGDYRSALEYYLKALKLLKNKDNLVILSSTQKNLGMAYAGLGSYLNSISYLNKSIANAEVIGNRYSLLGSYPVMIKVYEKIKNYKMALQYFGQYTILKDSIDGLANQNKISQFKNIYEREKKAKEIEVLKTGDEKFILISTIAITILSLIVFLVLLSRYRIKSNSNKILIRRNKKIDDMLLEVNELNNALKISEATYRNLFERNPMPMLIWEDKTRNIMDVNNALINHYGYSKEEFLVMNIKDLRSPEFMYQLEKRFISYPFDFSRIPNIKHKKKNGEIIDVEILSHSFLFEGREAHSVMIQDVTERKHIEQAVMDSEERYRNLFEGAPDAIVLIDYKLRIIKDANPSATKLFRTTWAELIGNDYLKLFPSSSAKAAKEYFSIISKNFNSEIFETEIILGDSSKAFVEISGILVSLSNYTVYQVYIRDITIRKETEKAIRESEKKLIKIQKIAHVGNWELDLESRNFWFSDEARSIFGIEEERSFISFDKIINKVANDDKQIFEQAIQNLVREGIDFDISFKIKGLPGNEIRILYSKAELIKNENGEPVKILGALRNITEIKQYQEELLRAKEEAEFSDRLKSDFLAQMSHEIRSPVNIILSFASLVREKLSDRASNDMKTCFNAIDNGGRRLIRTIDLVLNVADIQTGKYDIYPEKTNLVKDIIDNLMLEFASAAVSKNIQLKFVNNIGEKLLYIDRYTITQIFANLIDNAIKYTRQGSVTVELSEDKDKIYVSVEDTGRGISQEYLPRLFDPFTQEEQGYKRRLEGTGLGLSLVKKYCELNEAYIKVESEKGKGTKFTIVFQAYKPGMNLRTGMTELIKL